jgi:hypothetical protein
MKIELSYMQLKILMLCVKEFTVQQDDGSSVILHKGESIRYNSLFLIAGLDTLSLN